MIENWKIIQTADLKDNDKKQLFDLWNNEYPAKLSYHNLTEFEDYLQKLSKIRHFLLTIDENLIFGWAFTFERENEIWFAIIISEKFKGQGFGRRLLDKLKQTEPVLNGWVIDHHKDKKKNGETYESPMKFYEQCDFTILLKERLETNKISAVKIKWTDNTKHPNE